MADSIILMCVTVAVCQPSVLRAAQPQPGRRRHQSRHLEGNSEGEGGRGRRPAGAAARRGVTERVRCSKGLREDADGEARHPMQYAGWQTRCDLIFDGPWTLTCCDDPKPFLRHDSGQNVRDRVIVPDESLRVLCRANTWFMDGNFSLAPPVCDQLYVIRAPLGTTCISCCRARPRPSTRRCWRPSLTRAQRSASTLTQPPSSPTSRWRPCRT